MTKLLAVKRAAGRVCPVPDPSSAMQKFSKPQCATRCGKFATTSINWTFLSLPGATGLRTLSSVRR